MHFLKTLFWVALAVGIVLFSSANWEAVTINLWGGLKVDIKLPLLVIGVFLLGFLPMLLVHRARMWTLKRRLDGLERQTILANTPAPAPPVEEPPLNAPDPQPSAS